MLENFPIVFYRDDWIIKYQLLSKDSRNGQAGLFLTLLFARGDREYSAWFGGLLYTAFQIDYCHLSSLLAPSQELVRSVEQYIRRATGKPFHSDIKKRLVTHAEIENFIEHVSDLLEYIGLDPIFETVRDLAVDHYTGVSLLDEGLMSCLSPYVITGIVKNCFPESLTCLTVDPFRNAMPDYLSSYTVPLKIAILEQLHLHADYFSKKSISAFLDQYGQLVSLTGEHKVEAENNILDCLLGESVTHGLIRVDAGLIDYISDEKLLGLIKLLCAHQKIEAECSADTLMRLSALLSDDKQPQPTVEKGSESEQDESLGIRQHSNDFFSARTTPDEFFESRNDSDKENVIPSNINSTVFITRAINIPVIGKLATSKRSLMLAFAKEVKEESQFSVTQKSITDYFTSTKEVTPKKLKMDLSHQSEKNKQKPVDKAHGIRGLR